MNYPYEAVRYICPDAPAQVTAFWSDVQRDECPWCHRKLSSHDHYLWALETGVVRNRDRDES